MYKVDCEINTWTASWIEDNYDWVSSASADCTENYNVDDVVFTAVTKSGDKVVRSMEIKSLKGGFQLKYGDEWNEWFSTDNPNGVLKRMKFGNVPPPNMDILDAPHDWEPSYFTPEDAEMPEEWKGKHIYFLNAEDKYHRIHNGKAFKVHNSNACLTYVAPDGLLIFNPTTLRKSFLGYAWYQVKSHTEEYDKQYNPAWELKAIYCLEGGSYNKANPPRELFNKK